MSKVKMTPFTYTGMKVQTLVDIPKHAPFDNEFWARVGDVGIVEKTIGDYHYVKFGNQLSVRVKVSDTKLGY